MLFNSIDFALFLPIVFLLYWFATKKKLNLQNILLFISSYFFYACWDWRFMFLLMFSTLVDYFTGIQMCSAKNKTIKKIWLYMSVVINLGFLGFFKYYNFFIESFTDFISFFGLHINSLTLRIILPVGISFYTFHGLSYIFDIYKDKIKAERNFIDYAVFVSFFPLLVSGPIERATHLLPQLKKERNFDYSKASDGMRQILWGLFKKVVIADNCGVYADMFFSNPDNFSGSTLVLGVLLFSFQIYGDFSGYSDIAIGTAKLFGIDLLRNFAYPYFSRDIAEYWRRWHISLSSWFRDYLYIPLGGSRGSTWIKIRNIFIIFIISGFWHGANWTFIIWGALNALLYIPLMLSKSNRNHIEIVAKGKMFPGIKDFLRIITTFALTSSVWIFFRAENLEHAKNYISIIFSFSLFKIPEFPEMGKAIVTILLTIGFFCVEWFGREQQFAIANLGVKWKRPYRWLAYSILIFLIGMFMKSTETPFIYFQF